MAKQEDYGIDFDVPGYEEGQQGNTDFVEQEKAADSSDISLFWLLQHYNKENAAAYKIQQARKKEEKKRKQAGKSGKKRKKKIEEDNFVESVPLPHEKIPVKAEEKHRDREDKDFGGTVYVKRENRQALADMPVCVAVLECLGYGQAVPVDHFPFLIGRSPTGVDLCIADNKTVGRKHAVVSCHNGFYYIKDLNSLNHVFVNGRQIPSEKEVKLTDGAQIILGNEEFVFHISTN